MLWLCRVATKDERGEFSPFPVPQKNILFIATLFLPSFTPAAGRRVSTRRRQAARTRSRARARARARASRERTRPRSVARVSQAPARVSHKRPRACLTGARARLPTSARAGFCAAGRRRCRRRAHRHARSCAHARSRARGVVPCADSGVRCRVCSRECARAVFPLCRCGRRRCRRRAPRHRPGTSRRATARPREGRAGARAIVARAHPTPEHE